MSTPNLKFNNIITDAEEHVEFMDFFLDNFQRLALLVRVDVFLKETGMSSPTYYRRIRNKNLWTFGEIKTATQYFKKAGLIK